MSAKFEIPYEKKALAELTNQEKELVSFSEQSLHNAHAPYSQFAVGSAVRMTNGQVYSGNNQENAAYPSGLCAERVALFKAKSETKNSIEAIVVVARNEKGGTADAFPCGSCRQVMMEYASLQDQPIKILMRESMGSFVIIRDVKMLLPFSFRAKTLK